jgi:hypothetical protein
LSEPFDSWAALTDLKAENALLWEYWLMNECPIGTISDGELARYQVVRKELWERRTTQTDEETK